jgi:hypothetical protein
MKCPYCAGRLFDVTLIPPRTVERLNAYVFDHVDPGGFLEAVLTNNLKEAFQTADDGNLSALPAIVSFMYNHMPARSHGSKERVAAWLAQED